MKYEDNLPESKKLLKSNKNIPKKHEPSLLSTHFLLFLKSVNISLLSYIILSTFFYLIVHYYGKRIINSKSWRIEYDNLLYQNLFVNFYFILATILGFIAISKKSLKYFSLFYLTISLYSVLFITCYLCNIYSDFFFHSKFIWFGIIINIVNFSIFVYLIYYFVSVVNSNQRNFTSIYSTPSAIIHEIYLRTDMFKISFNHFIIRWRLHKLVPSLLYKRDSFYFTTLNRVSGSGSKEKNVDRSIHVSSTYSGSTHYRSRDMASDN